MKILPYTKIKLDEWSIDDDLMRILWYRLVNENIHEKLFYDGNIINSESWIEFIKSPSVVMHVVQMDNKSPGMIAWLTDFGQASACCHFATFKDSGPSRIDMAKMTMDYWFKWKKPNGEPVFKTLIGKTPDNNRAARLFLRKIGWNIIGIIPDMSYDIYDKKWVGYAISFITREEFYNGRGRQRVTE